MEPPVGYGAAHRSIFRSPIAKTSPEFAQGSTRASLVFDLDRSRVCRVPREDSTKPRRVALQNGGYATLEKNRPAALNTTILHEQRGCFGEVALDIDQCAGLSGSDDG